MMNNIYFEFSTVEKIIFGVTQSQRLGNIIQEFGEKVLIITGKSIDRHYPILDNLKKHQITFSIFPIEREPTLHMISEGTLRARQE